MGIRSTQQNPFINENKPAPSNDVVGAYGNVNWRKKKLLDIGKKKFISTFDIWEDKTIADFENGVPLKQYSLLIAGDVNTSDAVEIPSNELGTQVGIQLIGDYDIALDWDEVFEGIESIRMNNGELKEDFLEPVYLKLKTLNNIGERKDSSGNIVRAGLDITEWEDVFETE